MRNDSSELLRRVLGARVRLWSQLRHKGRGYDIRVATTMAAYTPPHCKHSTLADIASLIVIFMHIPDMGWIFKNARNSHISTLKSPHTTQLTHWLRTCIDIIQKKTYKWSTGIGMGAQTLVTRDMQKKIKMRHHLSGWLQSKCSREEVVRVWSKRMSHTLWLEMWTGTRHCGKW